MFGYIPSRVGISPTETSQKLIQQTSPQKRELALSTLSVQARITEGIYANYTAELPRELSVLRMNFFELQGSSVTQNIRQWQEVPKIVIPDRQMMVVRSASPYRVVKRDQADLVYRRRIFFL